MPIVRSAIIHLCSNIIYQSILLYFIFIKKCCQAKRNRRKRSIVAKGTKQTLFSALKEDLTKIGFTPHYMIELSEKELRIMGKDIISVSRTTKTSNGMLNYITIKYRSNVKLDGRVFFTR